ncbi:MAG: hypothetical protein IPG61_05405 [bacterium]|nr:hypothetical protein [bacterium]
MRYPILARVPAAILAAGLSLASATAHADDATDYRYYVATLAAADAGLQLHDVAAAKHWLEEAPPAHRGWEWNYLRAALDRSAAAFNAHQAPVTDLSPSPDGKLLASCGGTDVILWDAATGSRVALLSGHTRATWNARFSPDGSRIASVGSDGTLRLWDVATALEARRIAGIGQGVAAVAWSPDGTQVATVSWKRSDERGVWGVVDIWDAATGANRRHLEHGVKPIGSVNFTPDGSRLWIGTWDYDVAAYDTATWEQVFRKFPPEDPAYKRVNECRPSADGTRLAVAHDDGAVRIHDTTTGALLHTLHQQAEGARLPQNDVVWLPGGHRVATVSKDLTLRIWDADTGEHLSAWHGHEQTVTALAVTPDGSTLFSGDAGGVVRRWDLAALAAVHSRWSLPGTGYAIAVSADGWHAASTGWGGWIAIIDPATGSTVTQWDGHGESGVRAAWSPGDSLLATTGNDGLVRVWDLRSTPPRMIREHRVDTQSTAVDFSADGRWLASPAKGPVLRVWSTRDGSDLAALADSSSFSDAVWHPMLPLLAACGDDGVVRVWEPSTGALVARLEGHGDGSLRAAFSQDGTRLAAASNSGLVRVWATGSWRLEREMSVANGGQIAVAFSPDGRRLATAGSDGHVHLWDPATGAHLLKAPCPGTPYDLAWSNDGKRLLVVPLDGTIRVFE